MSMDTGSLAFILLNKWPTPKRYVSLWINESQMSSKPQLQQVRHPLLKHRNNICGASEEILNDAETRSL